VRQHRLRVRTDLVRHFAGAAEHAVAATITRSISRVAFKMSGGVVGDDGVRNALLRQFPEAVSVAPWLRGRVSSQ